MLSKLYDFVETYMIETSHHQQKSCNQHVQHSSFQQDVGFKWEGEWIVQAVQGPTTYVIIDGKRDRMVHINRLHKLIQPSPTHIEASESTPEAMWNPPMIEYEIVESEEERHYHQCIQRAQITFISSLG